MPLQLHDIANQCIKAAPSCNDPAPIGSLVLSQLDALQVILDLEHTLVGPESVHCALAQIYSKAFHLPSFSDPSGALGEGEEEAATELLRGPPHRRTLSEGVQELEDDMFHNPAQQLQSHPSERQTPPRVTSRVTWALSSPLPVPKQKGHVSVSSMRAELIRFNRVTLPALVRESELRGMVGHPPNITHRSLAKARRFGLVLTSESLVWNPKGVMNSTHSGSVDLGDIVLIKQGPPSNEFGSFQLHSRNHSTPNVLLITFFTETQELANSWIRDLLFNNLRLRYRVMAERLSTATSLQTGVAWMPPHTWISSHAEVPLFSSHCGLQVQDGTPLMQGLLLLSANTVYFDCKVLGGDTVSEQLELDQVCYERVALELLVPSLSDGVHLRRQHSFGCSYCAQPVSGMKCSACGRWQTADLAPPAACIALRTSRAEWKIQLGSEYEAEGLCDVLEQLQSSCGAPESPTQPAAHELKHTHWHGWSSLEQLRAAKGSKSSYPASQGSKAVAEHAWSLAADVMQAAPAEEQEVGSGWAGYEPRQRAMAWMRADPLGEESAKHSYNIALHTALQHLEALSVAESTKQLQAAIQTAIHAQYGPVAMDALQSTEAELAERQGAAVDAAVLCRLKAVEQLDSEDASDLFKQAELRVRNAWAATQAAEHPSCLPIRPLARVLLCFLPEHSTYRIIQLLYGSMMPAKLCWERDGALSQVLEQLAIKHVPGLWHYLGTAACHGILGGRQFGSHAAELFVESGLGPSATLRVVDAVLSGGLPALFSISIALLKHIEQAVLYGEDSHLSAAEAIQVACNTVAEIQDVGSLMGEAAGLAQWPEFSQDQLLQSYTTAVAEAQRCYARSIMKMVGSPVGVRGHCTEWSQALNDPGPTVRFDPAKLELQGHVSLFTRGHDSLMLAAAAANIEVLKALLGYTNTAARALDGSGAIHFGAESGSLEVMCLLLAAGCDVTAVDNAGHTPVHLAAYAKDHAMCACILRSMDQNAVDVVLSQVTRAGCSPLHCAAVAGSAAVCRVLLEHGANVHASTMIGTVPIHCAAWYGHLEVASILRDGGTMANIPAGSVRWTPLHIAVHQGHMALVQKLLQTTPDPEGTSTATLLSSIAQHESPLLVAAHRQNLELCKLLLLCRAPLPGMEPMGDAGWVELVFREAAPTALGVIARALQASDEQRVTARVFSLAMTMAEGKNATRLLKQQNEALMAHQEELGAYSDEPPDSELALETVNSICGQACAIIEAWRAHLLSIQGGAGLSPLVCEALANVNEASFDTNLEVVASRSVETWARDTFLDHCFRALCDVHRTAPSSMRFEERLQQLHGASQSEFLIAEDVHSASLWSVAVGLFQGLNNSLRATHKLATLVEVYHCIIKTVEQDAVKPRPLGADDLQPIFCFVVAQSGVQNLLANRDFMRTSFHALHQAAGFEDFCLTMFEGAIRYIEDPSPEQPLSGSSDDTLEMFS
eukprot:TRINITY_DN9970_c0_g1_i7.p1 TRINITY_DN9970_c0_g1~~TRINITY_DN9970_c0_g1_i7.p1  ORF type:complete len:1459 (+),score=405.70 TRINITY_DN9970_c0_g1_i7:258-4634(+)